MWDGKKKAVTFSYDDGIVMDKKLVEIFNRYGMKCTFNLNSGIQTGAKVMDIKGHPVTRMNVKGLKQLYKGHEVAVHTLTHSKLTRYDDETIYNEIAQDKYNLENMFEQKVYGMAYPYGDFNEKIMEIAKTCGIEYARTVISTGDFEISNELLALKATSHHGEDGLMELVQKFVDLETDRPQLLYIWGHSYEFEIYNNWERIEEICKMLSGKDDIYYGTNTQVLLGK